MATITLQGNEISTMGELPVSGNKAPEFKLVTPDLTEKSLSDYKGQRVVLNIFPSIDTGVCAASTRAFNKMAGDLENTKVVCVSRDLPFAMARFCGAEGLDSVETLSDFKTGAFGKDYQLTITNGPLEGLHSRAVVVLDEEGVVRYSQQVSEIAEEPDYDAAIKSLG